MRSWKEEFGSFSTNALEWDAIKQITFLGNGKKTEPSRREYVEMAIKLAKKYNCKIVRRVTYRPDTVGGSISFVVECHSLTYRWFYEGGKKQTIQSQDPAVTTKDIERYKERFGTTLCAHPGFKKRYWYADNWTGEVHEFPTLKAAKEAAKNETGNCISIYTNYPCKSGAKIVCMAEASEFMPP